MEKYLVIDERAHGDCWETVCDTPEEANAEAREQWEYLTPREQKTRERPARIRSGGLLLPKTNERRRAEDKK